MKAQTEELSALKIELMGDKIQSICSSDPFQTKRVSDAWEAGRWAEKEDDVKIGITELGKLKEVYKGEKDKLTKVASEL